VEKCMQKKHFLLQNNYNSSIFDGRVD